MRITLIALLFTLAACSGSDTPKTEPGNNANNENNANNANNVSDAGPNNAGGDVGEDRDSGGGNNTPDGGPGDDGGASDGGSGDMSTADGGADMGDDMGMVKPRGECASDADCNGTTCLTVPDVRGGYGVCQTEFDDPTRCQQDPNIFPQDECCKHTECTDRAGGQCVTNMLFFCGGALPPPQNVCRYDGCQADSDCTETSDRRPVATCVPAGAFGEPAAVCSYGTCQVDADCTERAGGECTAFFAPCANRFTGFFCTYDDSTCRADADCPPPSMQFATPKCVPGGMDDETQCIDWLPPI